jgi:diguanylate cyclase (GGDEF)-like protein
VIREGLKDALFENYVVLLTGAAFLTSIFSLILARRYVKRASALQQANQSIEQLKKRNEILLGKTRRLSVDLELLSAMREISRIVSDVADFELIFDNISRIVDDLMEAVDLTIYAATPEGRIAPIVHRQQDKSYFNKKIEKVDIDDSLVEEVWENPGISRSAQDDYLTFVMPLEADFEKVGVLKVTLRLEGDPEEKEAKAEQYETFIKGISKHIALAIKTSVLHNKAMVDGLTRLNNRAHFHEELAAAISLTERQKNPLSLIMLDIDHFKSVNDTYGHPLGDKVLVEIADILRKNLRKYDTAYRYGGEELAVLLPNTELSNAVKLAERVRKRIESHRIKTADGESIKVTASFGVAQYAGGEDAQRRLVKAADEGLYLAKQSGRNQVRTIQERPLGNLDAPSGQQSM